MRTLLLILVAVIALIYFTMGLRFGYVTLTDTWMLNATGVNNYSFRTLDAKQVVGVTGSCRVTSGNVTLRLFRPDGSEAASQLCERGAQNEWTLSLLGKGQPGLYRLEVIFDKFTGHINLKETRAAQ